MLLRVRAARVVETSVGAMTEAVAEEKAEAVVIVAVAAVVVADAMAVPEEAVAITMAEADKNEKTPQAS